MTIANKYTDEFKQKAIAEAERLKSCAGAARRLGVPESTLQRWALKYRKEKHDEQLSLQPNQKDKAICEIERLIKLMQDIYDYFEVMSNEMK